MEHASVKVVVWNRKNKLLNEQTLYRKTDKAIRKFNAQSFIKAYSGHLLNSEETMKKHILNMIYNNSVQWISLEQQSKQGTDDIVRKLYKEFKE